MGSHPNITADSFPRQGDIGAKVDVCLNYDTERTLAGEIVRDDLDAPYLTIIKLEDGRHVLTTECQWRPK